MRQRPKNDIALYCCGNRLCILQRLDVVPRIAEKIAAGPTPYLQTRAAAHWTAEELSVVIRAGALKLNAREARRLDKLRKTFEQLPDKESELIEEMLASPLAGKFVAEEYGLDVGVPCC